MDPRRTGSAVPLVDTAAALLARPEVEARAHVIAERVCELVSEAAAVVYVIEDQNNPLWKVKATAGDITVSEVVKCDAGTLGRLAETRAVQVFEVAALQREDFSHLDVRRSAVSLAYIPLVADGVLVGAIEVVGYEHSFPATALQSLSEIAELASPAIAAALKYENERDVSLQSISRVTQMYDLEKVFNSTLELDDLLPMIAKKFAEVMNVQGINLWMVNGDVLELISQAGFDGTVVVGNLQRAGEGIAGDLSESGESVLIDDPEDERLQKRNTGHEDSRVFSLVAAPLMELESLVGVVEAVNRHDGLPFDEDDHFLLINMCETASNALHNADLLQAERKLEVLEALVKVSNEITSTLDLDRVLQAIVNEPGTVIHYERAAIALEVRGKLQIKAVTGAVRINPQDPDIVRLQSLLEWASVSNNPILVSQHDDEIDADREETRAKFQAYFAQTGMRGFHSLPLADDDGRIGMLSFESGDPDFLSTSHLEMIKVLAGQATVALRNATLYREVPFIDLLAPILNRKRKFLALRKRRRMLLVGATALVVIFLAGFPLPLRVEGFATVAPSHSARIQPEVAGLIQRVDVHEGEAVSQGTVLARLDDWQYRMALAAAQAKYETAVSAMDRALASNDGTEAGIQRVQADFWSTEVMRNQERLEKTLLRTPIAGRVATAHIEDFVGLNLHPGDTFAEVVDTSHANIDVAIDEADIARVDSGLKGAVKLEGLPNHTFHAPVVVVSPKAELNDNQRLFYARLVVPNEDGLIRSGMQGRGKISTGWAPAGWVIFRRPTLWLWSKFWSWFGW
ncbi:MAG: GAF domain-containing protein [Candidatus Korobacteraceae bacterium]|jgi:RND family efflux transporter MFP subunit